MRAKRAVLLGTAMLSIAAADLGANSTRPSEVQGQLPVRRDGSICLSSDGILRFRLPCGWTFSFGPGIERGENAAWVLLGNFPFPDDYAATHEGAPDVPKNALLVGIGDMSLRAHPEALDWPSVQRLRLPTPRIEGRSFLWRVRFAGRALTITVRFGSEPTTEAVRLVNAVLASATILPPR
jgi:hypothetical protein